MDSLPGPGAYNSPALTRTGEKLDWRKQTGAPAAAAFKGPERNFSWARGTSHDNSSHAAPNNPLAQLGGNSQLPGKEQAVERSQQGDQSKAPNAQQQQQHRRTVSPGRSTSPTRVVFGERDVNPSRRQQSRGSPGTVDTAGPGPGSYDMFNVASISAQLQKQRQAGQPSRMFQKLAAIEHPHARATTAPAAAFTGLCSPRTRPSTLCEDTYSSIGRPSSVAVSSPFKSTAPGHESCFGSDKHLGRAPGPAFYKPHLLPYKQSFHKLT